IYDLWGDTVNIAARMESQGVSGGIQISEATRALLPTDFVCEDRGEIAVKGKGAMRVHILKGRATATASAACNALIEPPKFLEQS
ncbi:MAG TPA: adenylate/guanylate cyclase domain-containing protein, partial [Accumulibacter sp.]|nr:adenylate/guanylate cyclase domain-containing protein [Accumulibacter sp.]